MNTNIKNTNNTNVLPELKTPSVFYPLMGMIIFMIIVLFLVLFKVNISETKVNLYGESLNKTWHPGVELNVLINKSGQIPFLSNLLQGHKVVMNKDRLQKMDKKINDCGRWSYVRVILKHRSLKDFKKLFKSSLNPDEIVCLMTSLIF